MLEIACRGARPVSSPAYEDVNPSPTFKGLVLTTVLSLAIAASANAAPAGDEYVPQIPSSTGDQPIQEGPAGLDAAGGSPSEEAGQPSDQDGVQGTDGPTGPDDSDDSDDSSALLAGGSDDDDSSSGALDTLLDPIVLLLIAGVLTIAVGMTLVRRQGDGPNPANARRASSAAPPTPDGQIVAGGEERS